MSGAAAARHRVVEVALFAPLRQTFDYALPEPLPPPRPGQRVVVPVGHAERVGVVLDTHPASSVAPERLKPLAAVLDAAPLLDESMLALARWAAAYYHHPVGEVLAAMLPTWLRRARPPPVAEEAWWQVTAAGQAGLAGLPSRAHRQREVAACLGAAPVDSTAFAALGAGWRATLARFESRGWVERVASPRRPPPIGSTGVTLNPAQQVAADAIVAALGHFTPLLLEGVTGSGKTEVYLEAIAHCLAAGRQALVLMPEIALTQHLVARFRARFGSAVGVLHSALGERERALTWAACRAGETGLLLGTRSAVWTPFVDLALVVVDEEHDPSYKQQDGLRYSARDVAIVRAQRAPCPVVLGSATPSLETLANVSRGRYRKVVLRTPAVAAAPARLEAIDVRGLALVDGLSDALAAAIREALERGEQALIFLNRRGYAPVLICRQCGEPRRCDRCDAYLVYHRVDHSLRCHHCDRRWPVAHPAACCAAPDFAHVGLGTERLEGRVRELFPAARVARVDRDAVRGKAALDAVLTAVAAREVDILIGTQMVAKGLDFAGITLVGIVDADSRLYAVDFRAEERLAQILVQVAGRAGRAEAPGRVLVQTHHPAHPVLKRIMEQGYGAYAEAALAERAASGLPPYRALALVRAEAPGAGHALAFLAAARAVLATGGALEVSYPLPAAMERRAGRYRALVVLSSPRRADIARALAAATDELVSLARRHRVRWSLDIDPQDTL